MIVFKNYLDANSMISINQKYITNINFNRFFTGNDDIIYHEVINEYQYAFYGNCSIDIETINHKYTIVSGNSYGDSLTIATHMEALYNKIIHLVENIDTNSYIDARIIDRG